MQLIPNVKLDCIPTGNRYIGNGGLVDLGPHQSTVNVAQLFPYHKIDDGSLKNIRSHLLAGQIRVSYHENNLISEIEILTPDPRVPSMAIETLMLGDINLFGKTLNELKSLLESDGYDLASTDQGFDLKDGSVLFYSHDYEDNLDVNLDAVLMKFV